ncbi:MAG: type II secretion system F family protein [Clostridia bacterium]|nr:type II secretion system F family protein [Clostridia bacterium]
MAKGRQSIPDGDIALFSRQLSLVSDSDISMQQGLAIIGQRSGNVKIREISAEIIDGLNNGKSFYDCVKGHSRELGGFFIEMAGIGEKSGNMPVMLKRIADTLDKQNETAGKIKSAIIYPLILSVLMLAVIILLIVYVLPMFNDILLSLGGEMPGVTRMLMNFGTFITRNILWIALAAATAVLVFRVFIITEYGKGRIDCLKLHIPFFRRITIAGAAARFARNLAMLLKSGVNLTLAVEMLAAITENKCVSEKLKSAASELGEGKRPDQVIDGLGLFPMLLVKLIAIAHETGHMEATLDKAADIMEKETEERVLNLTTALEPILIIILSLLVGFILISVILPVTGIMNSIG